jgi:CopA family copper-resistance protein
LKKENNVNDKNMKNWILILISVFLFETVTAQTKTIYTCVMHPEVQMSKPGDCPKCGMTLVKKTIRVAAPKQAPKKAVSKPKPKPAVKAPNRQPVNNQQEIKQPVKSGQTKTVYTCVMHPEVTSDKPGKCPKCGMTLVKKTVAIPSNEAVKNEQQQAPQNKPAPSKNISPAPATKTVYTCVMHPEVQQDKPGKCPKCGMTLVKKTIKTADNNPAEKDSNVSADMDEHDHGDEEITGDEAVAIPIGNKVNLLPGKTVVYHLYVTDTIVNFTGKKKHAYAINGSLPAPTLYFTEGDTAEIYLHNRLKKEETSLHWHGVILPNKFDGVPYLTTKRIRPRETYLYKFRVVQNGTYWYHSHTALQEQQGMYGALIFKKREEHQAGHQLMNVSMTDSASTLKHYNVVLSEWADEDPTQTQRRFRTGNDWFSIKKSSTQSYSEAIKEGHFNTKLLNEWKRMKAMDVSDDYYERFLVNGKPEHTEQSFKAGDKVALHVVNAGASSYFWLGYGGGKITVVGNDGNELEPVEVDRLIIAPAETYDVVVTIPEDMSYEFRATSEDRTGASSLWLGNGMKMPAPKLKRLKYFEGMKIMNDMMRTNGTMSDMGMKMSLQQMDMNMVMYPEITGDKDENNNEEKSTIGGDHPEQKTDTVAATDHSGHKMAAMEVAGGNIVTLNYGMMKAPYNTALPDGPMKTLHFNLTGNMNRYVWTLDNKTVNEADRIMIQKGENLRIILTNNSMMRHPMHLHGHDFRVVNGQGDYAPLKNVIDIMPMETDTIEFAANQDGNWFFHCHILFHMMAGMGRVFTYENSPVNTDLPDRKAADRMFRKDNNMYHLMARVGLESNGSDGEAMLSSNRYALQGIWHLGTKPHHGHEGELAFGRYMGVNQWLFPYVGFDYHYKKMYPDEKMDAHDYKNMFGQVSNKNNRSTFTAGVQYVAPWLVLADARVDGNGKFRFQLSREDIPITSRLRFAFMGNTDKEYMAGFRYVVSKWLALSTHYDSDMGLGAGVTVTY